jgi:hypothetical protein
MLFKLILINMLALMKIDHTVTLQTPEPEVALFCEAESRPCDLTDDIVQTVEYHKDNLPFDGPYADVSTAFSLLYIAYHESGFRKEVQTCQETGDNGRSVSNYQLLNGVSWQDLYLLDDRNIPIKYTKDEICSDNGLATHLALGALLRFPNYPRTMFFSYAGNDGKESKAGKELYNGWLTLLWKNGYYLNQKRSPRWVEKKS